MIDFIIKIYGLLLWKSRLLSPVRFVVRWIGNKYIPKALKREKVNNWRNCHSYTEKKVIVSFTSFPGRIDKVWIVVKCLLRQTVRPDKIVLWLSKEQFKDVPMPGNLREQMNDIFEIRMVNNDYRSHKKYCYAFKEFRDDIVILIDDDIFYPSTMIEDLLDAMKEHSGTVICRYGSEMGYNADGKLLPFNKWWNEKMASSDSNNFFLGTGGGSLFLPKLLVNTVADTELATRLTPFADDIWINAMIRMSSLPTYKIKCGLLLQVTDQQKIALKKQNAYEGQNDIQFSKIIEYFMNEKKINPFIKRNN